MLEQDEALHEETESQAERDAELVALALERFDVADSAWRKIHQTWRTDSAFAWGKQWDDRKVAARTSEGRSTLTYNKVAQGIRFIENNARANMPQAKVHPVGDGADKNTARILQGLIRAVEYKSDAQDAYINALVGALSGGFGVFRVIPDQKFGRFVIDVEPVLDPTAVLFDPAADRPGLTDAEYVFHVRRIPRKMFEEQFPDASTQPIDSSRKAWFTKESVQVLEYWIRDGETVRQYILSASEILTRNEDYPGKFLPYVFVPGQEIRVGDVREFRGLVSDVRDIQQMLNYAKSEAADAISGATKTKWLVEAGMISNWQEFWNKASTSNFPYLPYDSKDGNRPVPIDPPPPPAALINAAQEADADIRATLGIRDPLQDIPASQSGKAIALQIQQSNIGTFGYLDRWNKGINRAAEMILDLVPYYYSDAQIMQIMGEDGQISQVQVNSPYVENGETVLHDLRRGEYACTISTGPSYQSQKAEAADRLSELVAKYPALMQAGGDLVVGALDFPGAEELSARLRAAIPPEILAASNPTNGDGSQVAALTAQSTLMAQQLQQLNQALQQTQAQLQQAVAQLQDKSAEYALKQAEIDARIQVAQIQAGAKLEGQILDQRGDASLMAQQHAQALESGRAEAVNRQIENIGKNTNIVVGI